jgi:hypothetical protein
MKKLVLAALSLTLTQAAFAETLTCYNTYTHNANPAPTLTAKIISNSHLEDVTFAKWIKNETTGLEDYDSLKGKLNESNHSPYKGVMDYSLPNGDTLYLPTDLSEASLKKAAKTPVVRGFNAGENGVIIGNAKNYSDGAGNHYSYRLRCESDKR